MKTIEEKCFDLLESTNLNWSVSKIPLVTENGLKTESHGIFRNDSNIWLGTVGNNYIPLQNSELGMILLNSIEGLDIEFTRGGQLKEGKKVYLQAELKDETIGNSKVKRWITALNSQDGTTSVGFGSANTVVVCQNTFFRAYGEVQKFRHTTKMKERIAIAQIELRSTLQRDDQLMESFKKMADFPLKDEAIEKVVQRLFKIEKNKQLEDLSVQKQNRIADFADSLKMSVKEQGQTIWALFNGITRFVNHIAAPQEITRKMDYIMLTGGAQMMNEGYTLLRDYTDEQKPKQKVYEMRN